jgi:hypothetical protein
MNHPVQPAAAHRFYDVSVEPHAAVPDGFSGRWMVASDPYEVSSVYYEPDEGPDGEYPIEAVWSDGRRSPARAVWVEDSAAGLSLLVSGGDWGLRIGAKDGPQWAEAYLLLAGPPPDTAE